MIENLIKQIDRSASILDGAEEYFPVSGIQNILCIGHLKNLI